MAFTASLTEFRISALDYKLERGYKGPLKIDPEAVIAIPEQPGKSPLICRYRLQIIGDGNKEFRFDVTGEGYFQLSPEQQAAVREKERAAIAPIFREMEKQMQAAMKEITDAFRIKPIPLEVREPDSDSEDQE